MNTAYNDPKICSNNITNCRNNNSKFIENSFNNKKTKMDFTLEDINIFLNKRNLSKEVKERVIFKISNNQNEKRYHMSAADIEIIIFNEIKYEKGFNDLEGICFELIDFKNEDASWNSEVGGYYKDGDIVIWAENLYNDECNYIYGYTDECSDEHHHYYVNLEYLKSLDFKYNYYLQGRLAKAIKLLNELIDKNLLNI